MKLFRPFVERKPWAAVVICLTFGPELGMLYLNRVWYALGYWLATAVFSLAIIAQRPDQFPISDFVTISLLGQVPGRILGAVHGYALAQGRNSEAVIKWYARWYNAAALAYLFPALLALVIRTFLYQSFNMPSASMRPTVNQGDYFLVSKLAYWFSPPQRGDVVVFYVDIHHVHFVKRVVGLPHDRVQMKGGLLFLNGRRVPIRNRHQVVGPCDRQPRCFQYEEVYSSGSVGQILDQIVHGPDDDTQVFTVPDGNYFVVGDNRDNSSDSRDMIIFGFVPRESITGKVTYKYVISGRWGWQRVH